MEEKKHREREMSPGLLRQRRNVLLVSVFMPLFFLSGAAIEKINLLGTLIKIENQIVLKWFVVLIFGYCCLRYWQYYREEDSVSDIPKMVKKSKYRLELKFLVDAAREKVVEEFGSEHMDLVIASSKYGSISSYSYASLTKEDENVSLLKRKAIIYVDISKSEKDDKPDKSEIIKVPESFQEVEWELASKMMYESAIEYNILRFYVFRVIGLYRYILHQSYFTDYQLPILVAAVSFVSLLIAVIY